MNRFLLVSGLIALASISLGQPHPLHAAGLIIPFMPPGAADAVARVAAGKLTAGAEGSFVVDYPARCRSRHRHERGRQGPGRRLPHGAGQTLHFALDATQLAKGSSAPMNGPAETLGAILKAENVHWGGVARCTTVSPN